MPVNGILGLPAGDVPQLGWSGGRVLVQVLTGGPGSIISGTRTSPNPAPPIADGSCQRPTAPC